MVKVAAECLHPDSGVISTMVTLHLAFLSHLHSWADEITPISTSVQE